MSVILHDLGFERPHLLARTGTLMCNSSTPLVESVFKPVEPSGDLIDAPPIIRSLPIGHLCDLRSGDIVHPGGRVTVSPGVRTYTTTVDVGGQAALDGDRAFFARHGWLPISSFDHANQGGGTGRTRWHALTSSDGSIARVLIPAFQIFLTYFAPNSRLAREYMTGEILDLIDDLKRSPYTYREGDGTCHLSLPSGRLMSDAVPLGRVLFDPTGGARQCAMETATASMRARRKKRSFAISCKFPFAGRTTLTYRAKEYCSPLSGERCHIVLDILQCTFALPYERLDVTLDQSSPVRAGGEETSARGRRPGDFEEQFLQLDPDAPEPERSIPFIARTKCATSFPNPGSEAVSFHRRASEAASCDTSRTVQSPVGVSVRTATGSGELGRQEVQFAPDPDPTTDDGTPEAGGDHLSPVEALDSVTDDLLTLSDVDGCAIAPIVLSPVRQSYQAWVLNEIPNDPPARGAWATIVRGSQKRCLLIYSVRLEARHVYVFEILRNPKESFSTLVAHRLSGAAIEDDALNRLYMAILSKNGLPKSNVLTDAASASVERIRHPAVGRRVSRQPLRRSILALLKAELAAHQSGRPYPSTS